MASKRRLQDKDITQELILDTGSDTHMSEDKDVPPPPPQIDSDNEGEERTDRLHTAD
jgi:hypothetical protein